VDDLYWETKGKVNSEATVAAALRRAEETGIRHLVVASRTGRTAELFLPRAGDLEVVCVTHQIGYFNPGEDEMAPESREKLLASGIKVLTTTHLMAGLDRACRNKFGGVYPAEIIAGTLRIFGQGLKVCVEIAGMAVDAGLVPASKEMIAVGGSATGADTAIIVVTAHSQNFFDTKIKEIICKPKNF
jgi:hypothetical protein